MQRKIIINFMYQVSYQILIIFLPVVTIPIVSDALGPKGLGTYNYITSIAAYFILVGRLGMANYGVREISIVQRDRKKLSEKFWELQFFNSFFSLGSLLVFVVFAFFTDYTVLFL
ncbi:MAG: flippase, partial [Staphylococcus equorum]|nr:flippase [Staphylococcus equorum]